MKPHITLVTLGVDDLQAAVAFYRDGLGWQTDGIVGTEFEHGAVAFFPLQTGLQLALWPRKSIAHDSGLQVGPRSPCEITLAYNVNSSAEVDAFMKRAIGAGAHVVTAAGKTFFGGYSGYITDPDGHLWEVCWNPKIKVPD